MKPVYLACLGDVDGESLAAVDDRVRSAFCVETRRLAPLSCPGFAYDPQRRQYSSIPIMRELLGHIPGDALRLLALTECDLFIPMLSFIYGQAQLQGSAALVSLARLRQEFYGLAPDAGILVTRVRKEAAHEMGHTFGLVHCLDRACPMSLSTNIRQLDLKGETFCTRCTHQLQESMRT